jgi:hypothetical protein
VPSKPKPAINSQRATNSIIGVFLVMLLAARLRETDVAVAAATFLPMRGRLACALIELAHHFGEDVGFATFRRLTPKL